MPWRNQNSWISVCLNNNNIERVLLLYQISLFGGGVSDVLKYIGISNPSIGLRSSYSISVFFFFFLFLDSFFFPVWVFRSEFDSLEKICAWLVDVPGLPLRFSGLLLIDIEKKRGI